jgi:DNA repair protein RecO (recombination protein O)
MNRRETVLRELGYVLHQRPYRNTSQLLECYTLSYGRVGLVANGSRRPTRGGRALLQPFVPLEISWLRRGELGRLTAVEPLAKSIDLCGTSLLAGFYVNELLLRLTARDDANEAAFSCYQECLEGLHDPTAVARSLRVFEFGLLQALGYGLDLSHDVADQTPLAPDKRYIIDLEIGPRATLGDDGYSGRDLISLRERELWDEGSLNTARQLLTRALQAHLGGRELRSRAVLKDIMERGLPF